MLKLHQTLVQDFSMQLEYRKGETKKTLSLQQKKGETKKTMNLPLAYWKDKPREKVFNNSHHKKKINYSQFSTSLYT